MQGDAPCVGTEAVEGPRDWEPERWHWRAEGARLARGRRPRPAYARVGLCCPVVRNAAESRRQNVGNLADSARNGCFAEM